MNKYMNKGRKAALVALPLLGVASSVFADGTDIVSDLQGACTDKLTALVASVGVILLAGFAIPVAKKAYSIVKSALSRA